MLKRNSLPSLKTCLLLDAVGCMSYLIPVAGEAIDFIWAPISAIVFYFIFGKKKFGFLGGAFAFLEELSPGLDFIPTFTIAWLIRKYDIENELLKMSKMSSKK